MQENATTFETGLKERPENVDARLALASTYEKLGRHQEALDTYKAVLKRQADNLLALDRMSQLHLHKGNLQEALRLARHIAALHPGSTRAARAHFTIGYALARQGKVDPAQKAFERGLKVDSTDAKVYYNLSKIYLLKGRLQEAERACKIALARDPDFAPAHYGLGISHAQQQAFAKAIPFFQRTLQLDSTYVEAYFALGDAHEKIGTFNEALHAYGEFVRRWQGEERVGAQARTRIAELKNR